MTQDLFELEPPVDELGNCEAGPAHLQAPAPVSQLTKHWEVAQEEFNTSGSDAKRNRNITQELLALGAIRAVYWLAVGSAELASWHWQKRSPSGGPNANHSTDWGRPSNDHAKTRRVHH